MTPAEKARKKHAEAKRMRELRESLATTTPEGRQAAGQLVEDALAVVSLIQEHGKDGDELLAVAHLIANGRPELLRAIVEGSEIADARRFEAARRVLLSEGSQ